MDKQQELNMNTEVVINNEQFGIIISDGLILENEDLKYYLVQTCGEQLKVSQRNLIAMKEWVTQKFIEDADIPQFWKKMVHQDLGKNFLFFSHYFFVLFMFFFCFKKI